MDSRFGIAADCLKDCEDWAVQAFGRRNCGFDSAAFYGGTRVRPKYRDSHAAGRLCEGEKFDASADSRGFTQVSEGGGSHGEPASHV